MLKRSLYFTILPFIFHKNAIVITGMRQVGKTTLMKQLFETWEEKKRWFDFDNPLDTMLFENPDYNAIYENLKNETGAKSGERFLICIDEIQNFPEITRIIKYLIYHFAVKFIVTGSSNFYLRNLFPESLSGRKFLFVLPVLSFFEYLYFKGITAEPKEKPELEEALKPKDRASALKFASFYQDYLHYGGFPEVVLTKDPETRHLILKNIFASFVEKDIKIFSELRDVRELRDLLLLLGPRNGNLIDVTKVSSELGINRMKIYNYLEFLEGTFFIRLLPKYSKSIDRSVAGGKKIYFTDTGLLNMMSRITEGQLLEVAVASQLQAYGELSFYNKRNTLEIDFILNDTYAFEVKQKATEHEYRKLKKVANGLNITECYMISNSVVDMEGVVYPWFL